MANENYTLMSNQELVYEANLIFGKSSHKLPSTIKKHSPELLKEIEYRTQFLNEFYIQRRSNVPINARLYCLEHDLREHPKCPNPNCPNHNPTVEWRHTLNAFAPHCSFTCGQIDLEVREKYQATCEQKYGVKNTFQSKEVKARIKEVLIERYNVENPSQSPEIQQKKVETFIRNYNTTHPLKCDRIKAKSRATNEKRFGGPAPMCSSKVKRKMAKTCNERYGGIGFASEELLQKSIETTIKRHGKSPIELMHEAAKYIVKSKPEQELDDFVKSICNCEIEFNCRTMLKDDRELDIYIPSKKLAIEFNGDYWHMNPRLYDEIYYNSQSQCTAKEKWEYDRLKQEECRSLGIKLIVVWEHDWIHSRKEVEDLLKREFTTSN